MKKLINAVDDVVNESLAGFCAAHSDIVRLGNVQPTRDLNFVSDIVDGFLAAAAEPKARGQTINLGSGRETSIVDLANLIGKLIGRSIKIEREEKRVRPDKSEVERLLASNKLAETLLHWQPKISLEDGLEQTIGWIEKNIDKYRTDAYVV